MGEGRARQRGGREGGEVSARSTQEGGYRSGLGRCEGEHGAAQHRRIPDTVARDLESSARSPYVSTWPACAPPAAARQPSKPPARAVPCLWPVRAPNGARSVYVWRCGSRFTARASWVNKGGSQSPTRIPLSGRRCSLACCPLSPEINIPSCFYWSPWVYFSLFHLHHYLGPTPLTQSRIF